MSNESNLRKFGVLYRETDYKSHTNRLKLNQYYELAFLIRRLGYVLIILLLYKFPIVQQCFNIAIHLTIFLYDIIIKPHGTTVLALMIYLYDFILVIIFGSLPLFMIFVDKAVMFGRIHIYILIGVLILSWIIIVIINIHAIYKKYKKPTQAEIVEGIIAGLTRENNETSTNPTGITTENESRIEERRNPGKVRILVRKNKITMRPHHGFRFRATSERVPKLKRAWGK